MLPDRSRRATRRRSLTYALMVALSLVLIAVSGSPVIRETRRALAFAISPIQGALTDSARSVTSMISAFGQIDQLRRDNLALQDRVAALETEIQQLIALRTENERLAALLGLKATLAYQTVAADVISRQTTELERVITLDRGTDTGVAIGDPVLSEGGALCGVVTDAGRNWASVMLISDPRSIVIGLDEQTRTTGEITGRLSALLAMSNIPATEDIAAGDTVVTAGLDLGGPADAPFPRGLLIGRVVEVQDVASAVVKTAFLDPADPLDHLERVLVVKDFEPPASPGAEGSPGATSSAAPTSAGKPSETEAPRRTDAPSPKR